MSTDGPGFSGQDVPPPGPPGGGGGGWAGAPQGPAEEIPNHLVWAILTTIFCCLPFGIVSIVFAAQVDGKRNAGDIQGAWDASNKAKTWAVVAAVAGVVAVFGWVAIVGVGVLSGLAGM